jgi:hypothetical protein
VLGLHGLNRGVARQLRLLSITSAAAEKRVCRYGCDLLVSTDDQIVMAKQLCQ